MSPSESQYSYTKSFRNYDNSKKNQRAVWAVVLAVAFLCAYFVLLAGAMHALDSKDGFSAVLHK
jgi:uncharacterized membrane protein (DUF485 family)